MGEDPEGKSDQKIWQESQDICGRDEGEEAEDEDNPIRLELEEVAKGPEDSRGEKDPSSVQEIGRGDQPAFLLPAALLLKDGIQGDDKDPAREPKQK